MPRSVQEQRRARRRRNAERDATFVRAIDTLSAALDTYVKTVRVVCADIAADRARRAFLEGP